MTYGRPDLAVQVALSNYKGYTMKDIGGLDQRIKNLEYYTVLNALALDTQTTSVRDSTGTIERFKNGIFADPFNDPTLSRTNDIEYSMAVDSTKSIARPNFNELFINFDLASSTNLTIAGKTIMLNYTNEKLTANPFATTYRNCTEQYFSFKGKLTTYPSFDNSNVTNNAAPQNVTVDIASSFSAAAANGAFKDISSIAAAPVLTTSTNNGSSQSNYWSQTTTNTITDIKVQSSQIQQDLGNFVKDVALLPYMNSRTIAIVATGMKPNTVLHPFFDGTDVTQYCSPASVASAYQLTDGSGRLDATKINGIAAGSENSILQQAGAMGSTIISDQYGNAYCIFIIPANKFRSGDRTFTLTNTTDLTTPASITTIAEGIYTSSSLAVTQQPLSFSLIQPTFTPTTTSYNTNVTWVDTVNFPPPPPPPPSSGGGHGCCFDGEANVTMADGSLKQIKLIEIGDLVLNSNGNYSKVVGIEKPILANRKMYSFNNNYAFVSEEHPFLTTEGWGAFNPESWAVEKPFKNKLIKIKEGTTLKTLNGEETVTDIKEVTEDANKIIYNLLLEGDHTYYVENYLVHNKDPVGETFVIGNLIQERIPGTYLTQVGVYFQSKSPTLGISLVVVQTLAGLPDSTKIVGQAYLHSSQVVTSDDSSAETVFTLYTPALLQADATYAFYLSPDGPNPDYNVFISEVGGVDILTGQYISQQPYTGVLVASSSGTTWTTYQAQDIKFNLYRAKFTSTSGTAVFRNTPDDYITVQNIYRTSANGYPIQPGDLVYCANNSNPSQTLYTNNQIYPFGKVKYADETKGIIYINRSNGLFTNQAGIYSNLRIYRTPDPSNTSYINSSYQIANCQIVSVDDIIYHGFVPKYNIFQPVGTTVSGSYYGTSNSSSSFQKDSIGLSTLNETLFLQNDYERVVRSYSNEVAQGGFGSNGTATEVWTLNSGNMYLSPVIDLRTRSFDYIQNLINNDATNEYTRYGNAKTRYISKVISLNTLSQDLLVYLTAYKPVQAQLLVFAKFFRSDVDSSQFDNKLWTQLQFKSTNLYNQAPTTTVIPDSSQSDLNDYRELVFGIPQAINGSGTITSPTSLATTGWGDINNKGILTYTDELGALHQGFNMFALKIVFLSSDPTKIPTLRDVRGIATMLSSG